MKDCFDSMTQTSGVTEEHKSADATLFELLSRGFEGGAQDMIPIVKQFRLL